jgi:hypothetical protein
MRAGNVLKTATFTVILVRIHFYFMSAFLKAISEWFYILPPIYLLLCSALFLLGALICYFCEKPGASFFCFYFGLYFFLFYSIKVFTVSSNLLGYVFYLSVFIVYHYYYTFTRRFTLRVKVIIKRFWFSKSFLKLILWGFFILLPTLLNNRFIVYVVFSQLLGTALLSRHIVVSALLSLLCFWFCFLAISCYFNLFAKTRHRIVLYFSRRACLHFIGNTPGSKLLGSLYSIGGVNGRTFSSWDRNTTK